MLLVLLNALPFDARMWDGLRPRFADAYSPTLYGLGSSVREWADAILEECGGRQLLVVGTSVGACCALEIARAAPEQVRGVIMVSAKASVRRDPRARDDAIQVLHQEGIAVAWDRYWAPLFGGDTEPEVVAAARLLALEQDVDDLITGVRAFYDRRDHSEFLATWRGRLLVVSGAEDRTPTPVVAATSVVSAEAEQMIVENAGHYVPLEQPEALCRAVEDQLRMVGA